MRILVIWDVLRKCWEVISLHFKHTEAAKIAYGIFINDVPRTQGSTCIIHVLTPGIPTESEHRHCCAINFDIIDSEYHVQT